MPSCAEFPMMRCVLPPWTGSHSMPFLHTQSTRADTHAQVTNETTYDMPEVLKAAGGGDSKPAGVYQTYHIFFRTFQIFGV